MVRLNDDFRKGVAFIGFGDAEEFSAKGTGFFVGHDGYLHFVTAKHIAIGIGDNPFHIRLNTKTGNSQTIHIDPINQFRWFFHDDETVDVAVFPVRLNIDPFEIGHFQSENFATDAQIEKEHIGAGDRIYTIGLFRLMVDSKRNLPIVHSGSIAMVPHEEKVPVRDWDDETRLGRKLIEAFLVEQQSLQGLSGSPVLVQPHLDLNNLTTTSGEIKNVRATQRDVMLLGVWQGSWEATPDEVLAAETVGLRVALGVGVVVPSQKVLEILESDPLKRLREAQKAKEALKAELEPSPQRQDKQE